MGLGILITVNNKPDLNLTNMVSTVEVYEKMDAFTTYKIRFMVDICDNDIAQSLSATTSPECILGVLAEVNDQLTCLVSGPVNSQEAHLEQGGAGSWLDVTGTDSSWLMDKELIIHPHTGKDSDIVRSIFKKYNIEPKIDDTPDSTHSEDTHTAVQKETDLAYVRRLAQRNGFHFWLTYDNNGRPTGYFKPRNLQGEPKTTLLMNSPKQNIDNLQIKWDLHRPTQAQGSQVDLTNKKVFSSKIDLTNSENLGAQNLAKLAGKTPATTQVSPSVDDAGALNKRATAVLNDDAAWFINATCKTTTNRLCTFIRFHTIVAIDGLGEKHSGKYYITGVKHAIDTSAHVMEVEMARNAWGTDKKTNAPKILS
jgi:hypothetical protein